MIISDSDWNLSARIPAAKLVRVDYFAVSDLDFLVNTEFSAGTDVANSTIEAAPATRRKATNIRSRRSLCLQRYIQLCGSLSHLPPE